MSREQRSSKITVYEGAAQKGADAISKSPERYPHLSIVARIGPASRLFWLKIAVILAFCAGLLISNHLWTGPRTYPPVPVWDGLPQIEGILAYGLFAALFALAAAILVAPRPQWLVAAFLAVVAAFCALDQTRWQPWVFLYGALLAALALFSWDSADAAGQRSTLNIARLILACTYIFSGLQKINANFIDADFPWIVQPITNLAPATGPFLRHLGMAAPFVQVAFGVGLMTKRFRRVSLVSAVAMHIFILAMLGPVGLDWNGIVWPWTATMALFDLLLFAGKADFTMSELLWSPRRPAHVVAIVMFGVLPILSFFNLWDSYLSAALYSGNLTEATIYVTDVGKASLPAPIATRLIATSAGTNVLNLQRWAYEELNVTPYPETRVYKAVAKDVCRALQDPAQLVLLVREQRMFFSRPETSYRCWEL